MPRTTPTIEEFYREIELRKEAELRLCKTIVVKGNEVHRLAARVKELKAVLHTMLDSLDDEGLGVVQGVEEARKVLEKDN